MANRSRIAGSIEIDASPAEVWAVVSDLKRMGEWSPQCRRMLVIGGDVAEGTRTINWNGQGALRWPTTAKVVGFEPERRIAFRVEQNRTIWSYALESTATGTRVTESREAPHGVSPLSNLMTARVLGGTQEFELALEQGIARTLARVKSEVEAGARRAA